VNRHVVRISAFTAAVLSAMALHTVFAAANWMIVSSPNPNSQVNSLASVACAGASHCVAVGSSIGSGLSPGAQTLIEQNTGSGWAIVDSPSPNYYNLLSGVTCVSAGDCWAVGSSSANGRNGPNQTLIEHETGNGWAVVSSPSPSSSQLSGVACVRFDECWAVGTSYNGTTTQVLIEHLTGSGWTTVSPNPSQEGTLFGVTCASASDCWAVGHSFPGGIGHGLIEHFTGSAWTIVPSPIPSNSQYVYLNGVTCSTTTDCWVVGASGGTGGGDETLIARQTGSGWTLVSSPHPDPSQNNYLTRVACVSASDCWAVGFYSGGADTLIVHNTGSGWVMVSSPNPNPNSNIVLSGVACGSAGDCSAVGSSNPGGTLIEAVAPSPPPPSARPHPTPIAAGSGGSGSSGSGAQPVNPSQSLFGTSLATPIAAFSAPVWLAINALVVFGLVLFVVFPAQLFNHTYEQNHERIQRWWAARMRWIDTLRERMQGLRSSRRGLAAFVVVTVAGGVLGSLLDPGFGANARTLALALAITLAILVGAAVSGAADGAYRTWRHFEQRWELRALPTGLFVTGLCVAISRLTEFQPGYLYGLIGGVAFAGHLAARQEGHAVALASIATLLSAVIAWLIWVPVDAAASQPGAGFALAFLGNFLAAVFVSGLVGLVIGLVPLRFLPGEKVAAWHWGPGVGSSP
jgi:hypothetical protein